MRAAVLVLAVLAGLVLAGVPSSVSHPAGEGPEGYTRVFHDCQDDWAWHGSSGTPADPQFSERGHDATALDVTEKIIGSEMLLVFSLIFTTETQPPGYGTTSGYVTEETFRFSTPRATIETRFASTTEPMTSFPFVSGDPPAYISGRLETNQPMDLGGGPDSIRYAVELGYAYEDILIQKGEAVTGYEIQTYYDAPTPGGFLNADLAPGGYYASNGQFQDECRKPASGNPADDADFFLLAAGYTVQQSTWSVPGGDDDNGTPPPPPPPGEPQPPIADFTFTPARPSTADTIQFTDTSHDPENAALTYLWDFGDGSTSTSAAPTHRYPANAVYPVRLTVTDPGGLSGSVQKLVQVLNLRPTAGFTFVPAAPAAGDTVTFTDASADADGTVSAWAWNFGDGEASSEASPTHTYAAAGTFTVTLTVTDDDGAIHAETRTITVAAAGADSKEKDNPSIGPAIVVVAMVVVARLHAVRHRK